MKMIHSVASKHKKIPLKDKIISLLKLIYETINKLIFSIPIIQPDTSCIIMIIKYNCN